MLPKRMRRCAHVLLELRECSSFDFESLVSGGDGLSLRQSLVALAPHLPEEVEVSSAEATALAAFGSHRWIDIDEACGRFDMPVLRSLIAKGLLIGEDGSALRVRDDALRAAHWWAPAAVMHYASRWRGTTAPEGERGKGPRRLSELFQSLGPPPPHLIECAPSSMRIALPRADNDAFDDLLDRRTTCRNFDTERDLQFDVFARLMQRVFSARSETVVPPDVTVMKRTSPSGGGLHPTEVYVIAQRVHGVAPGLYHYHPAAHALEPLPVDGDVAALALRAVAGQEYFSDAHVLVVLASRFPRSFWKYRNHSKAYRAVVLDVGHLSQCLYICATEQGLAAYVTAAINEVDIEQALCLDPLEQSPIAVCGFGWRAREKQTVEFDPLNAVWPKADA